MLFTTLLTLLLSLLLSSASCTPTPSSPADTSPLPPSKDPWYTLPPLDQPAPAPGTVLRVRRAPGNLTQVVGRNCSASYNVLFATRDSHLRPTFAVTTVFVPANVSTNANSTHALLSYQYPYNSNDVDASPSYALYATRLPDVQNALGRGWFVSVPDFEGPAASFLAGLTEGRAVLDSLRALHALPASGPAALQPLRRAVTALQGYSGGSFASEFAAELQPAYAPDLAIAGAAIGGLPDTYTGIFDSVDGSPFAGLLPTLLLGVASQYPRMHECLLAHLRPSGAYNRTGFLRASRQDAIANFATFANQSVFAYFDNGRAILDEPAVKSPLEREAVMGRRSVPRVELFVYKAIADELTPVRGTDELVQRYCRAGARVQYRRNTVGGHVAELVNGDAYAAEYLARVFAGVRFPPGCDVRDVTWNTTTSESLNQASGA